MEVGDLEAGCRCPVIEREGVASASEGAGRVEGREAGFAGLETGSPRMGGPRAPQGGVDGSLAYSAMKKSASSPFMVTPSTHVRPMQSSL